MKQIKNELSNIPFYLFIGDLLTNTCRQQNSEENSQDNLRMQEGFIATGGWSIQFPAVIAHMSNWFFNKSVDIPNGMSAEEFVAAEMARRADRLKRLEARVINPTDDEARVKATNEFESYKLMFCDDKGKLRAVTAKTGYWVSSGHQRTLMVMFQAFCERNRRSKLAAQAAEDAGVDTKNLPEFKLEVPSLVMEYESLLDVVEDQTRGNEGASNQNKCTVLDCAKSSRIMIGHAMTPAVSENQYRTICSDNGGNAGKNARHGYLLAEFDFQAGKKGVKGFLNHVFQPKTISVNGDTVPNPEHIPLEWVSVDSKDPTANIAVACRLIEPSLRKLEKYDAREGSGNKAVQANKKDSALSGIEVSVLKRGKSWDKEEVTAWVESRKTKPGNAGPVVKVTPKFEISRLKAIEDSAGAPTMLQEVMEQVQKGLLTPETETRIANTQSAMDAIYNAHDDTAYQELVVNLGLLREGDAKGFAKLVKEVNVMVDKAVKAIKPKKPEAPAAE